MRILAFFYFSLCAICVSPSLLSAQDQPPPVTPEAGDLAVRIKKLIEKLNANDNIQREEAERDLLQIGTPALESLKEAAKSTEPEVSARAKRLVSKLSDLVSKPTKSYAETLPDGSLFFFEITSAQPFLEKLKTSPLGKFWHLPESQKFYKGHREAQLPIDQRKLDSLNEIGKLIDGRMLMHFGLPDTADMAELDPPMVYLVESRQSQALEAQVRVLFESMQDPSKTSRRYGPYTIEEHTTAQSVFGVESVVHSLTQRGMEAYLDNRVKKPEKPLDPLLSDIRALLPKYDAVLFAQNSRFSILSDAAQLVDDDMIKALNTYGLVEGTTVQAVMALNADGVEEYVRLTLPTPEKIKAIEERDAAEKKAEDEKRAAEAAKKAEEKKPDGQAVPPVDVAKEEPKKEEPKGEKHDAFFTVLKKMAAAVPAPVEAGKPQALDLIPWQSGVLISFNGDSAKFSAALGAALRDIDALRAPPPPKNPNKAPAVQPVPDNQPVHGGAEKPKEEPADANKPAANTPGRQALAQGGADLNGPKDPKDPKPPIADPKPPVAAPPVYPTIARFEKIGLKFEQFLSLIDGPIQVALFPHQIAEDIPDDLPISPLVSVLLKDATQVEQSLDAGTLGPAPHFRKEVLNGGAHYIDIQTKKEGGGGFWMKGNYLIYSTERDLIDLAGLSLAHEKGNERITDRASYKQALATGKMSPDNLLTIFGDADQTLEMPYRIAKINWQEDEENPWPEWKSVQAVVKGKPVMIAVKGIPDGLQAWGQTPLTILGMMIAFRWPLSEAGLIE